MTALLLVLAITGWYIAAWQTLTITDLRRTLDMVTMPPPTNAEGTGSVAIGGDNNAPIITGQDT